MRSRRGSFDDAFSPLMAMPSVVDMDDGVRVEKDLLGSKEVPKAAYYGGTAFKYIPLTHLTPIF